MRQEDKFIIELLMPNTDWSSNEKLNNTLDWDYIIHHCTQHKLFDSECCKSLSHRYSGI